MDLPFNYARVLYDEKISSKDLKKMRELLTGAPELSDALDNPLIRRSEKRSVIEKLFPKSVQSFVKVMSDNGAIFTASWFT